MFSYEFCKIFKNTYFVKVRLYDEIFLSQVVKFFFRQFPFNIWYAYTAVKFFQSTIMKVFQKKKILPDFW